MSKTKIEIRAGVPVIIFDCGGCKPCGDAEYQIIKQLEQDKAELIKILSGTLEIASQLMSNDSFLFHFEQEILFLQKYSEED